MYMYCTCMYRQMQSIVESDKHVPRILKIQKFHALALEVEGQQCDYAMSLSVLNHVVEE